MTNARLRVRTVGTSSAVPRPGRACSCYYVQSSGARIVLDAGPGAVAALRRFVEPAEVDAVVVTHLHADHFLDLVQLRYVLKYGRVVAPAPLALYLPPTGEGVLRGLVAALPGTGETFYEGVCALREYVPGETFEVGDMAIATVPSRHYIDACAIRIEAASQVVVFSSDTAPSAEVVAAARGADLFICEAGLGANGTDREPRGHSSAREAGSMAAAAGAKHLILTHYADTENPAELLASAREAFGGEITVADDGMEFYT